jgi:hypothetical protein
MGDLMFVFSGQFIFSMKEAAWNSLIFTRSLLRENIKSEVKDLDDSEIQWNLPSWAHLPSFTKP